jgi:hypothetical protein
MLKKKTGIILTLLFYIAFSHNPVTAGLSDWLKGIQDTVLGSQTLTEAEITAGLKEALRVGTTNAIKIVAKRNGYYLNPDIKVPLPQQVQQVAPVMRAVGLQSQLDRFEQSMNRAAEKAAPEAGKIFGRAIRKMTINDAFNILDGPDDAATLFFKDNTWSDLQRIFKPEVSRVMAEVGVTRIYTDLNRQLSRYPYLDALTIDLDAYVTEKALQGLFVMLAREEKDIRHNPKARVTDLLKKVFA